MDTVYIVNGILDDKEGFEEALTVGDDIVIVRADGVINTDDQVTLSDGVFSGTPVDIDNTDDPKTVTIEFKDRWRRERSHRVRIRLPLSV